MTKRGTVPLTKGAVVETWHDDGRGGGPVFGLVTAAGPRRFSVTWESGIRQRRPQGCHHVALVPETRRDLVRLALVKAALLPQAIMEEIGAEHTAAAGARCIVGDDGCCESCGVEMSTCARCGGVGYHRAGCADSDASNVAETNAREGLATEAVEPPRVTSHYRPACGAEPCKQCPFRRTALRGWLGEGTPESFIEEIFRERPLPCHPTIDYGDPCWLDKWIAQSIGKICAGALILAANMEKRPRDPTFPRLPRDKEHVFATPAEFIAYHRGGGHGSWDL